MPRIEVVIAEGGGEPRVVNIGRPAALVAFGDHFNKKAPAGEKVYAEMCWLAHRALQPAEGGLTFEDWLEQLDDLDASDDVVEALERKATGNLSPLEQLEAMDGERVLELVDEVVGAFAETAEGEDVDLPAVVQHAQRELVDRRAAAEQARAKALELAQQAAAEQVDAVPTEVAPATTGDGE